MTAKGQILNMVLGEIGTNVYLVMNKETRELLIIDPASSADRIRQKIDALQAKPAAILLTHAHFDHIGASDELRKHYQIPVILEEHEKVIADDASLNLSSEFGAGFTIRTDRTVSEGEELLLAGFTIRVLHTPGHTRGGACYYFPELQALFSGDTLFCGSYGRIDFPTGSGREMAQSVRRLLRELPEETAVFPGHESFTDIRTERRYNPLAERSYQ